MGGDIFKHNVSAQCHVGVDGSFCKNFHEKFRPMIIHGIRRRGNNDDTNAFVCVV